MKDKVYQYLSTGIERKWYIISIIFVYILSVSVDYLVVTYHLVSSYWDYDMIARLFLSCFIALIFMLRLRHIGYSVVLAILPFSLTVNSIQISKKFGFNNLASLNVLDLFEAAYYVTLVLLAVKTRKTK